MAKKKSSSYPSLAHHFLIALPSLEDPVFSKTVVYVYEHNQEGAMGLVVNKPLGMNLNNVLQHLKITTTLEKVSSQPVMMGGPIGQEHGFVLYDENDEVFLSSSKETLIDIANDEGPLRYLVTLGYSGWQAGQLEIELQRNDWLIAPYRSSILFNTPVENRWQAAARLIGIDIFSVSQQVGRA